MQNIEQLSKLEDKTISDVDQEMEERYEEAGNQEKKMSFEEKLRLAVSKDSGLEQQGKFSLIRDENITGATANTTNNFLNVPSENVTQDRNNNSSLKGKKIFRIKKYVKYNKFLAEICSDEDVSENEKISLKDPNAKKISPFSKVNFSKLNPEEKDERLKNLAKLVKRLRRKVRNLEHKVRFNATKLLNKYIWSKLGINTKNKYLKPEFQFDFEKICKALKKVKSHEDFEFDDQKHLIENIINLVADEKLKIDSLSYKKICSILRRLLPNERIKFISKKGSKAKISFPETEVFLSNKEYEKVIKFKDNEEILRAILGVYDEENEKKVKVISDHPVDSSIEHQPKSHPYMSNNNSTAGSSKLFLQENQVQNQNQMINNSTFQSLFNQNSGNSLFMNNLIGSLGGLSQINQFNQINRMNQFNQINPFNQLHSLNPLNQLNQINQLNPLSQQTNQNALFSNLNSDNNNPQLQQLLLQSYTNLLQNPLMNLNANMNNTTSNANSSNNGKPNNVFIK